MATRQIADVFGGQFWVREGGFFFGSCTFEDLPYGIDRRLVGLRGGATGQGEL